MPEKDPLNYGVVTYLWVFALAMLGGAVLIGISGHMGSRAIFRVEKWAEERFK